MKAIRYLGPNQPLKLEEIPLPKLGPGEILIRVRAAGICHTDLHFLSGLLNLGVAPLTLGHEIAGSIEAVGPEVEKSRVGERVVVYYYQGCGQCPYCLRGEENLCINLRAEHGFITDGGYAEFVKVPSRNAVTLPPHLNFEDAAPIGCSVTTAIHASKLANLRLDDNVVVYGVGGVGFGIVQYARLAGANVIAISRSDEKLAKAKELGAIYLINSSRDNVAAIVREITHGLGADIIFEMVGIRETMDNSVKCLAKRGRLIFIGYSEDSFIVHPIPLVVLEAKVMGSVGNTLSELYEGVQLVGDGKIKTVIDRVLRLDQFQEGINALKNNEPVGRVILTP
jgi:alcohol dehydrogenase, propanol-preferring